jgi:hypothetical protein
MRESMSPMLMTKALGTGLIDRNLSPIRIWRPGKPKVDRSVTVPVSVC